LGQKHFRSKQKKNTASTMQKEQRHLLIGIATPLLLVAILLIQLRHGQQNLTHAIIGLHEGRTTEENIDPPENIPADSPVESSRPTKQSETKPLQKVASMEGAPPEIDGGAMTEAKPLPGELIESPEQDLHREGLAVQLTYQPVTINHIYPRLQPFGRWFVHPRHGNVWMPRASSKDKKWRPYSNNGQWHYTVNGWHWQSNYKWGGTTFHHGRWFWHKENNGWVWVPGRRWSPAWVSWRESGDNVGWAPIPPIATLSPTRTPSSRPTSTSGVHIDYGLQNNHFTFVAKTDFLDENPLNFALSQEDSLSAFQESHSRGQITLTPRRAWANFGIPKPEMERAIGAPIEIGMVDFRNPSQPRVVTKRELEEAARIEAEKDEAAAMANNFGNQEDFNQPGVNPTAYWPGNQRYRNGSPSTFNQGPTGSTASQAPIVINGASKTTNQRTHTQQTNPAGLGMRRGQTRPNLSVRQPPTGK
jgi:hypothetical protein